MYIKGNPVLSRMFAHCGLLLNEKGLFYEMPEEGNFVILITDDHVKIAEAMGFKYEEIEAAKEYNDFFELLYTNQFFRPSKFLVDASEGGSKMLKELSEWLIGKDPHKSYTKRNVGDMFEVLKDCNFKARYDKLHELKNHSREIHDKFNGRIILKNVPDYDRRDLEAGMNKFNHDHFKNHLERIEFIYAHTEQEIVQEYLKITGSNLQIVQPTIA